MRALLDLMLDNVAAVQDQAGPIHAFLTDAIARFGILDAELGDKELGVSVGVEIVKLRMKLGDTELIQSFNSSLAVELAKVRLG